MEFKGDRKQVKVAFEGAEGKLKQSLKGCRASQGGGGKVKAEFKRGGHLKRLRAS